MSPLQSTHESLASQTHTECSVNKSVDTIQHTSHSYVLEETRESVDSSYSFQQEMSSMTHQYSSISTQGIEDSLTTQSLQNEEPISLSEIDLELGQPRKT